MARRKPHARQAGSRVPQQWCKRPSARPLRCRCRDHYLKVAEDGTTKVVHRVAIFDTHGTITHVISQLDVMRCAAREPPAVEDH